MLNFITIPQSLAEYNSHKLTEAFVVNIVATDLIEKLSKSQCSYVIKKKHSVNDTYNKTILLLNDSDKKK